MNRERPVWVTKDLLYAAKIHGKELGDVKALHDFNDMAFEAIAAPHRKTRHCRTVFHNPKALEASTAIGMGQEQGSTATPIAWIPRLTLLRLAPITWRRSHL